MDEISLDEIEDILPPVRWYATDDEAREDPCLCRSAEDLLGIPVFLRKRSKDL